MTITDVMTREHERWEEFCERLEGEEGCNFQGVGCDITWTCAGGNDKTLATKILRDMGLDDDAITASVEYFNALGGHCDCEILFNVRRV